jgi:hypothetical protein
MADFIAGVEFALRWISVGKKLPETNIPVIIQTDYCMAGVYRIAQTVERFACNGEFSPNEFVDMETGGTIEGVQFWRAVEL